MPLNEKALIARIRRGLPRRRAVRVGVGDDCAVLSVPPGHEILVTTDFNLEGVHFRREWHPPESAGYRCLARGLSDIAAMGGDPLAAFLSLALPKNAPQRWVDEFIRGLLKLAGKYGITLAGGDTAESPNGILADIVVLGSLPKGKAVLRSRARPGDRIYVTGALGASAATLDLLFSGKSKVRPETAPRHFYPEPRVEVGKVLRSKGLASAMIDLSDGLSTDLAHICQESGVGAQLIASAIPRANIGSQGRSVSLRFALHGGEDYELLFTSPASKRMPEEITGVPITQIGRIIAGKTIKLKDQRGIRGLRPGGWEHFRA